ncbi:MAG: hypothetical protein SNJ80_12830, partial [Anaerolinea sp.]
DLRMQAPIIELETLTPPAHPCPSCHHEVNFIYAGVQVFPLHVARAAGYVTHRFQLWTCSHCLTSITIPLMGDPE